MTMRAIFVPQWAGNTSDVPLRAALSLARKVEAHLDVVYVAPDQARIVAALRSVALGPAGMAEQIERFGRSATEEARTRFAAWRTDHGLPAERVDCQLRSTFAGWSERVGLPEQVIVRKGRLSDLIVLGCSERLPALDRALDAALFETGRPVLLVPEGCGKEGLLRHVVVAWNGSLEATRAVAGAMPLLRKAEQVTVLTTPGLTDLAFADDAVADDLDLPAALRWHGILASGREVATGTASAGRALLTTAGELDATMLVMGAYTHSRVTAAFLGGVTGHVLRDPPGFPVLMGH